MFQAQSGYAPEAYDYYIVYEHNARKIDVPVLTTLYERAITDTAKKRFEGSDAAEFSLRALWMRYCDFLVKYLVSLQYVDSSISFIVENKWRSTRSRIISSSTSGSKCPRVI